MGRNNEGAFACKDEGLMMIHKWPASILIIHSTMAIVTSIFCGLLVFAGRYFLWSYYVSFVKVGAAGETVYVVEKDRIPIFIFAQEK